MKRHFIVLGVITLLLMASCESSNPGEGSKNFLSIEDVADSKVLLGAPPAEGSAAYQYDVARYEWGKSQRATARGEQAVQDADLKDPEWIDKAFSEAFGYILTPENAPEIVTLILGMKEDAGDLCTRAAKKGYNRKRPFMVFDEPTLTPQDEEHLRKNGSYPSGHTAIGWATALVLAEINPDRQTEILQRGLEFGDSRVIVGAHFQSDVDAGRTVAAGVVARLHADDEFAKQMVRAKIEFAKLRNADKKK
ncbi:MAG: phosphatase PAP2 family protein [Lepagella sp.]